MGVVLILLCSLCCDSTFSFVSLAPDPVSVAQKNNAERLAELFAAERAWSFEVFPESALSEGDRSGVDRVTDLSIAGLEARHLKRQAFYDQLKMIDIDTLSEQDRINYQVFEALLTSRLKAHPFKMYEVPLNARSGIHQQIPMMAINTPFEMLEDYEGYLARLEQQPRQVDALIERMRQGMASGRTVTKANMIDIHAQIRRVLEPGGFDSLRLPLQEVPEWMDEATSQRLRDRFESTSLPAAQLAVQRLEDFVGQSYLPACRDSLGAHELPDGAAWYQQQLRAMTTTDLTAQEIYEIGQSEVQRIRQEMLKVIASSDFIERYPEASQLSDKDRLKQFIAYLRTDPRFYCETPEQLLMRYRDICKQIDGKMPELFATLPRLSYGVLPIPDFAAPTQTTAYYQPGSPANGFAGNFYANTWDLKQRPTYEMVALALHEAVPGHHHQIALAQEMQDVPEFRTDAWFNAFGEGWALYAERMGEPMGLYEDPYARFGQLTYEMWRACRLVVDPGLHAFGWTRQEAIDFMAEHTALSEHNIEVEVDRYITWPAQATSYKIGEIAIRNLRDKAEARLGSDFDVRHFHDAVLRDGGVPLWVLEERIDQWIEQQMRSVSVDHSDSEVQ